MDMHVQCHLEKPNAEGTGLTQDTVWLPEKFAVVGKTIKLRDPRTKDSADILTNAIKYLEKCGDGQ